MKFPFKKPVQIPVLRIPVIGPIIELLKRISRQNQYIIELIERITEAMATDFTSLLEEAKAQGQQLDKVLAEVQAGNASAVTPEQLDELKSVLDANQGKVQSLDDIHPDTPAPAEGEGQADSGSGETQSEG